MTTLSKLLGRTLVAGLFLALALPASAEHGDEMTRQWTLAPYAWLAGVSGDLGLPNRPGVDMSLGDVLDNLELAGFVRLEKRSESWRFLADVVYVGLGMRSERDIADVDVDTLQVELAAAWRANEHLDVLFGARYWDMSVDVDFDATTETDIDLDSDWVDPIVGIRLLAPIGDSWDFMARADVGGFGVGSDFTWNAEMAFTWNPNERFALALGYRHLDLDEPVDTRFERVDLNLAFSGPEIGFLFRF